MPIVFNILAIFQLVVAALVIGLLHLIVKGLGFDYDMIGGSREAIVSLQIMAWLVAYLDAKGWKGQLFFLPTWIILILGSFFFFLDMSHYEEVKRYELVLYISSALIFVFYVVKTRQQLRKTWDEKKQVLAALKEKTGTGELAGRDYWILASNVYYVPTYSFFYVYLNHVWKLVFSNAIDIKDFWEHYKTFLNTIDIDAIEEEKHKKWVKEFRDSLNEHGDYSTYTQPSFAFARLGTVIDQMNENYKD